MVNSLAQTVLRMTSPGVPDLYQGTDFWDFSLVDPDNRRPVDYAARMQALESQAEKPDIENWRDGQIKQQLVRRTLQLRAREPELFSRGEYVPLAVAGTLDGHVLAFARRLAGRSAMVVVTHLPVRILAQDGTPIVPSARWQDTAVLCPDTPDSTWQDIYTGARVRVVSGRLMLQEVLAHLPVAVLIEA